MATKTSRIISGMPPIREWAKAVLTTQTVSAELEPLHEERAARHAAPSPRYRIQAGSSSLTEDSSRQCWPLGGSGAERSVQPSSVSRWSALRWLHVAHA